MKGKKKIAVSVVVGLTVIVGLIFSFNFYRGRKGRESVQSTSVESSAVSTNTQSNESVEESGDSFNTDDLDTGIAKEDRSTGGLAHGVDETEASTEASEPETYAETGADGKNLTEPAQTIPTVEQGLSASEYGQIAESVQQQNNEAITDTSSDGSVGKDVNDAISAIQDAELEEAKRLVASPEFQAYFESVHAND